MLRSKPSIKLLPRGATRITNFTGSFGGPSSVSPDAQRIAFERAETVDERRSELLKPDVRPDLWVVNRDGSGLRLPAKNARAPTWSP